MSCHNQTTMGTFVRATFEGVVGDNSIEENGLTLSSLSIWISVVHMPVVSWMQDMDKMNMDKAAKWMRYSQLLCILQLSHCWFYLQHENYTKLFFLHIECGRILTYHLQALFKPGMFMIIWNKEVF